MGGASSAAAPRGRVERGRGPRAAATACALALVLQGCGPSAEGDDGIAVASTSQVAATTTAAPDLPGSPRATTTEAPDSPDTTKATTAEATQLLEIPLNARPWSGGMRLAISVSPVTAAGRALPAQELVLDTGSSTLAFCNASLATAGASTEYMSCNRYNPGGAPTGYWGRFYRGGVAMSGLELAGALYSVMEEEEGMPCDEGFQGIFGVAFKQLDLAFGYQDLSQDVGVDGSKCPSAPVADFAEPLLAALRSSGGPAALGVYWSGEAGVGEGALYLEGAATSNAHAAVAPVGAARLGEIGWYDIDVQEIALPAVERVWSGASVGCAPDSSKTACIMDTGTPVLVLPSSVIRAIESAAESGLPLGDLTVSLAAVGGGAPVVLAFDVATLVERQWLQAGSDTGMILGLPLWRWYYTAFDLRASAATFFPKPSASTSAAPLVFLEGNASSPPDATRRLRGRSPVVV